MGRRLSRPAAEGKDSSGWVEGGGSGRSPPIPSLLAGGGCGGLQSCSAQRTFRPVLLWFCSSPVCHPAEGRGGRASRSRRPGRRPREWDPEQGWGRPASLRQLSSVIFSVADFSLYRRSQLVAAAGPPPSSQPVLTGNVGLSLTSPTAKVPGLSH